jgi:tRNA dimethylallyltransferase
VRAVVSGVSFTQAPPDRALRRQLTEEAERDGTEALHARLVEVDPDAAARITPRDLKRIVRALEVYLTTGERISSLQALDRERPPRYNTCQFGLTLPREELYRRIEARSDRQLAAGLVAEVQGLLNQGYHEDLVPMKGLGYAHLVRYLCGACSLDEAVVQFKRDTRRFAKRQLTWFRADKGIQWVDMIEVGGPVGAAKLIEEKWRLGCE